MKPVCPNRYETLPLEELLVDLYFHDGVATVRNNEMLPEFCPSRTLFNAVESRTGELRAEGYRALAFINVGMIHIYAPDRRRDYYVDKYGVIAPRDGYHPCISGRCGRFMGALIHRTNGF